MPGNTTQHHTWLLKTLPVKHGHWLIPAAPLSPPDLQLWKHTPPFLQLHMILYNDHD